MMNNKYDDFRQAMQEARTTLSAADSVANTLAETLRGRLRKCSTWNLVALKKELQEFDAHKKVWKS